MVTHTAYTKDQAVNYDSTRFLSAAGSVIHKTEKDILFDVVTNCFAANRPSCLEVGCGTGRLLIELMKSGLRVDGVDASEEMVAELKKKTGALSVENNLYISEAASIPVDGSSYDLTYCIRLLNQTESPQYALSVIGEMVRLTNPGGFILTECVNSKRPRIFANRQETTRLSADQIIADGIANGCSQIKVYGSFFLGMSTFQKCPVKLLGVLSSIDRLLCRIVPRYCSRIYVLLKKSS